MSASMAIEVLSTDEAPRPAGAYSQAVRAGDFVFVAGQVPRLADSTPIYDQPFEDQVKQTMTNLLAVIEAAGGTLADVVKVSVFLKDETTLGAFDAIYRSYLSEHFPARTSVQSDLPGPAVEVDAVLYLPRAR